MTLREACSFAGPVSLGFMIPFLATLGHWPFWLAVAACTVMMVMGQLLANTLTRLCELVREYLAQSEAR